MVWNKGLTKETDERVRIKDKEIRKIKCMKKKYKMFDISVEKNHNFFLSNGVLSHNSYICSTNMRMVQKVKFVLPRSCYWRKEYPNFYTSHWEKMGGDWKTTATIKEEINELYDKNKDKYEKEANEKSNKKNKIREEKSTPEISPYPFGENFEKIKGATGTVEVTEEEPEKPLLPPPIKRVYPFARR